MGALYNSNARFTAYDLLSISVSSVDDWIQLRQKEPLLCLLYYAETFSLQSIGSLLALR